MRKWLVWLLIAALLFTMAGCKFWEEEEKAKGEKPDAYISVAQKYMDLGQWDMAITILQDGVVACEEDTQLLKMLDEALEQKTKESPSTEQTETSTQPATPTREFSTYAGKWSCSPSNMKLDIVASTTGLQVLIYENVDSGASADGFIEYSTIKDRKGTISYQFFWGESGTITFEFREEDIVCSTAENDTHPDHGFGNVTYTFSQESTAAVVDYGAFTGKWASNADPWNAGGIAVKLDFSANSVSVELNCIQGPPMNRIATAKGTASLGDIHDGYFTVSYDDDGWGNYGFFTVTLVNPNEIIVDIVETGSSSTAGWGLGGETHSLYPNAW